MEKKFFLFLLSLCVCGVVNVKAQVRIGGDNAPHPAAVLDLNPGNTADAKGGLLFPRVSLASVEDSVLFGTTGLVPGLVVYNTNEGDTDIGYLVKGLYVWDGREWLFISGGSLKGNLKEPMYSGALFEISVTPPTNVWLGRDGKSGPLVDIHTTAGKDLPDLSGHKVKYTWYFKEDTVSESIAGVVTTSEPRPRIPDVQESQVIKGRIYFLYCEMNLLGFTTSQTYIGKAVYGIGAWIGPGQWLNVANANVGGDQSLTLNEQWAENHWRDSVINRNIMGDRFQWGRSPDGHERMDSETYPGVIPQIKIANNGNPVTDASGKFALGGNNEWREYPDRMIMLESNGEVNADSTNSLRKPWYWRTMEDSVGVDPCSLAMDGFPGEWFVMTQPQWDSIRTYNRLEWLDTERVGGVAIYPNPNKDSNIISFYLPIGGVRSSTNGSVDSATAGNANLWLNSVNDRSLKTAVRISASSGTLDDGVMDVDFRAIGYPIRCVSKEF